MPKHRCEIGCGIMNGNRFFLFVCLMLVSFSPNGHILLL